MGVFAISDLHVDYRENLQWVNALSDRDYQGNALILAGDISHKLSRVQGVFETLMRKFARVFFVPGNHDLWVRNYEEGHSLDKLNRLVILCEQCGVETRDARVGDHWVAPLYSWYRLPEQGPDSLYVPKPGDDATLRVWSDNLFAKFPIPAENVTDYFLNLNKPPPPSVDASMTVITFSHFLPRRDLIFSDPSERKRIAPGARDPHPTFNFSRVAGTSLLED